jgi:dTDP-4-amino-4,6-dideoxygalactose transaminase
MTRSVIRVAQAAIDHDEIDAMRPALERAYYGHAENVVAFERALATYLGVDADRVAAVSSGTAALHLALEACGVAAGDEVILPSLTFVAAFQAVLAAGAIPVSCEVDETTLLMDVDDVIRRITDRTRVLMPMHYGGQPCDLDRLSRLAGERGLAVVEDAAHAFGTRWNGRPVGAESDVCCFSFDSLKTITCGEGGAVVTADPAVAAICRCKRLLGVEGREATLQVTTRGWRYHMSNLNAALGLVQLRKIDRFASRRREICRTYDAAFSSLPGLAPRQVDYDQVVPHLYVLHIHDGQRDRFRDHLLARGIETAINYVPNHHHALFRASGTLLKTDAAYGRIVSVPLHCALADGDVRSVIAAVEEFAFARASATV